MIFPIALFAVAGVASAQSTPASALCTGDSLEQLFCNPDLPAMLNSLFQLSITLGGILAMLRIGYAGFLYMGREDMWSTKTHAKEVFRDAIIGLLLLLAIWLILNQINPDILKLGLLQPTTGGAAGGGSATP